MLLRACRTSEAKFLESVIFVTCSQCHEISKHGPEPKLLLILIDFHALLAQKLESLRYYENMFLIEIFTTPLRTWENLNINPLKLYEPLPSETRLTVYCRAPVLRNLNFSIET